MEIRHFFVSPDDFCADDTAIVSGDEFLHMTKVLRHKVGYKVILCCGDGYDYLGTIREIKDGCAKVVIDERRQNENDPKVKITLFQALPKGDKMQLIVQKCTELGAVKIVPFLSRYTEEDKFNVDRMRRVAKEACKQCGRASLCDIGDLCEFDDIVSQFADYDVIIMPYENAECGKIGEVKGLDKADSIAVVIGSEGGFDGEEVKTAQQNGARIVSLGRRILRCETAGLVTMAIVEYEKGELQR